MDRSTGVLLERAHTKTALTPGRMRGHGELHPKEKKEAGKQAISKLHEALLPPCIAKGRERECRRAPPQLGDRPTGEEGLVLGSD